MNPNFGLPNRSFSENDAWRKRGGGAPSLASMAQAVHHPPLNVSPPVMSSRRERPSLRRGAVSASFLMRDACIAASAMESLEITRIPEADYEGSQSRHCTAAAAVALSPLKTSQSKRSVCDESFATEATTRCSVGRSVSLGSTYSHQRRRTTECGSWSCDSSFTSEVYGTTATANDDEEDDDILTDDEARFAPEEDHAPRMPVRSWNLPRTVSQSCHDNDDDDDDW